MKASKLESFRQQLDAMIHRLGDDVAAMEEAALVPAGGQANGELSNAPMHLGDSGTDAFHQELNSLLLENEQFLYDEVRSAILRLKEGTFGRCESCGEMIPDERLDAIPFARQCVPCAKESDGGPPLNLNNGRPATETDTIADGEKLIVHKEQSLDELLVDDDDDELLPAAQDRHAAGTPGGGTAIGGLAGTNMGHGGPEAIELEDAMGNGLLDNDLGDENANIPQSNRSGSAIGGTPVAKRSNASPKTRRRPQKG